MAFYKQDIVDINLNTGSIFRSFLGHSIGYKNDDADRFGVRVFRDGEAVDLTGASCQAVFMAPNGTNIALTSYGTVSGNVAYVTLPQACYDYEGQFCLSIQLVGGGVTGTMRIVDGMVVNTGATGTVAPTSSVPTYQEILSTYDAMVSATSAANLAIAETFDASKAYPAGKNVINDGALYVLPNGHTAGTTWANTTKVASNLGDQVTDLKSALFNTELSIGIYAGTKHAGYLKEDGTYGNTSASLSKTTELIPCSPDDVFFYKGKASTLAVSALFYNSSKEIIGNSHSYNTSEYVKLTIPSGASYVVFSSTETTNDIDNVILDVYSDSGKYGTVKNELNDKLDNSNLEVDITEVATVAKKYVTKTGDLISSDSWRSYIVDAKKINRVTDCELYTNSSENNGISFYSSDEPDISNYISGYRFNGSSEAHSWVFENIEIPPTAVSVVFANRNATNSNPVIKAISLQYSMDYMSEDIAEVNEKANVIDAGYKAEDQAIKTAIGNKEDIVLGDNIINGFAPFTNPSSDPFTFTYDENFRFLDVDVKQRVYDRYFYYYLNDSAIPASLSRNKKYYVGFWCGDDDITLQIFGVTSGNTYISFGTFNNGKLRVFEINNANAVGLRIRLVFPAGKVYQQRIYAYIGEYPNTLKTVIENYCEDVPPYWKSYMETKQLDLRKLDMATGYNGDSFVFITDPHIPENYGHYHQLIKYVIDHSATNLVFGGGDILAESTNEDTSIDRISEWISKVKPLGMINIVGNHDYVPAAGTFTNGELYGLIGKYNENRFNYATGQLYGYLDNTKNKIRYIVLNTRQSSIDPTRDPDQFEWFEQKVTELDSDWTIVVFAHMAIGGTYSSPELDSNGEYIAQVLEGNGVNAHVACVICGHKHYDASVVSSGGTLFIATTSDTYSAANDPNTKTRNTTTEQAFDVFHINTDPEVKHIYATRIGAGSDRDWAYN